MISKKEKVRQKAPLMILPLDLSIKIINSFFGFFRRMQKFFPDIKCNIEKTDMDFSSEEYIGLSFLNSLFFFLLFFALLFILNFTVRDKPFQQSLLISLGLALFIFVIFVFVMLRYPKILAGKKAEEIDKNMVFALKEMLMQITSGITLYYAMLTISKGKYGMISKEFERTTKRIHTGTPLDMALEEMALSSESAFLRKSIWQLVNTFKAGASLEGALKALIRDLTMAQRTRIRDYAHELNLWSMIYMLFAVAVPTIGATMLVVLSSFGGAGVTQSSFIVFLVVCFLVQIALIGFIKSRRPMVHM